MDRQHDHQAKENKEDASSSNGWNVRTMRTGLTGDLQSIDNARKTAVIDMELDRLNNDIACLQETRLADSGLLKEQRYVLLVG